MRLIIKELENALIKYEKGNVLSFEELIEIEQGLFLLLQEEEEWPNLFPLLIKLPHKESARGLLKAWKKKNEFSRRKLIHDFMRSPSYLNYQGIERVLSFIIVFSEEKSDATLSFFIDLCKRITEKGTVLPLKQYSSLMYETLIATRLYKNIEVKEFALNKQELISFQISILCSLFEGYLAGTEEIVSVLEWLSEQPQKIEFSLNLKKELLKGIANWPEKYLLYLENTNLVEKNKKGKSNIKKRESDSIDLSLENNRINPSEIKKEMHNITSENDKRSLSSVLKDVAASVAELEKNLEMIKSCEKKESEELQKQIDRITKEKINLENINRKLQERLSEEREKNNRFDLIEGSSGQLSALQISMVRKKKEETKRLFKEELNNLHKDYLEIADEEMSKGMGEVCRSILKKVFAVLEQEEIQ